MADKQLHITNGDSAATIMRQAGIKGRILPWRDILHDGPVPADLCPNELAKRRAAFLAQEFALSYEEVLHGFRQRDDCIRKANSYDAVTLWLEHDLYDQLQLLQILATFASMTGRPAKLSLICIDRYEGIERFYGLGQLTPMQIASLQDSAQAVSDTQLALAHEGWKAFTARSPQPLHAFAQRDPAELPFMKAALYHHFEEFPNQASGLSRLQRQLLEMIDGGERRPGRLFAEHQKRETAPWLGDWSYWSLIEQLCKAPDALLTTDSGASFLRPPQVDKQAFLSQRLSLTPTGLSVLHGEADHVTLNPPDLWKGGVHLHPDNTIWRWDTVQGNFTSTGSSTTLA